MHDVRVICGHITISFVRRVAAQHRDRNVTADYCDVTSPYVY